MNYFEFYAGDYRRDTGRLSLAEHGAYLLLLADYYSSEQPLPADLGALYRIAGAQGAAEQRAVKAVAEQFFPVGEDGLRHNTRADRDIAKAQKRINAARENGSKGGRKPEPKRNPSGNPSGSQNGTQWDTQQGTQPGEALHTPHAKQQLPIPQAPENSKPTDAGRACRLMREAGCGHTNPAHPDLHAALTEGVTPETLAATVPEAIERKAANPFTWAIATARGRHAQGPRPVAAGPPHADSTPHRMSKTALGIAALEDLKRETLDRMATGGNPDRPAEARLLVAGSDTGG